MVQASADPTDLVSQSNHADLPQALVLLSEMNVSVQHVASLVDNMIQRVRKGEMSTDQGLSFLEMKYNMLLSYLINLTYVVLRKCAGASVEADPCIERLVEIRTVLEKIKPIDNKLKYQIDKLVKSAVIGGDGATDPTSWKANPDDLSGRAAGTDDEENDSDESEAGTGKAGASTGSKLYVPPKLSAVHYTETTGSERQMEQERRKKRALSSAILQDLREEYLDTPLEVSSSNKGDRNTVMSKRDQERQDYEESYLTRLPVTKADKQRRRMDRISTIGTLGDEITGSGGSQTPRSRQGKKRKTISKGNGRKRKRFH